MDSRHSPLCPVLLDDWPIVVPAASTAATAVVAATTDNGVGSQGGRCSGTHASSRENSTGAWARAKRTHLSAARVTVSHGASCSRAFAVRRYAAAAAARRTAARRSHRYGEAGRREVIGPAARGAHAPSVYVRL